MKRLSQDVVAVSIGNEGQSIFIKQSRHPDPTEPQGIDLYIGNASEPVDYARWIASCLLKEQAVDLANALLVIAENDMWISTAKIEEK